MQVLDASYLHLCRGNIDKAAFIINSGGLVVFPTETVYGVGANALNEEAVAEIFKAKGRPPDNPLIVHAASVEGVIPLVRRFTVKARKLAEAFWPGPLTIILPKSDIVPDITSGGLKTVAVRIPSHPIARALVNVSGVPIAAPSANISGTPSPTIARHCIADLKNKVQIILDGGICKIGIESTVLSLAGKVPRLLRPGAVTPEMIREVIGEIEIDKSITAKPDESQVAVSPGMKYKHYSPHGKITIVHGGDAQFYAFAASHKRVHILAYDEDIDQIRDYMSYGPKNDSEVHARLLFSALRAFDDQYAKTIYARPPYMDELGLAVYNRLLRAAEFREIYL